MIGVDVVVYNSNVKAVATSIGVRLIEDCPEVTSGQRLLSTVGDDVNGKVVANSGNDVSSTVLHLHRDSRASARSDAILDSGNGYQTRVAAPANVSKQREGRMMQEKVRLGARMEIWQRREAPTGRAEVR